MIIQGNCDDNVVFSNSLKPRNKLCKIWFNSKSSPVNSKVIDFEEGGKKFRLL